MINIAVVDDQAMIRHGISEIIQLNDNYQVVWQAEDGQEALEKLAECPVDIIVSDMRMPRMDGVQMLTALREKNDKTPVLMLTTFDEHSLFVSALVAGCNGFLLKDITTEKLHSSIEHVAKGGFLAEPQHLSPLNDGLDSEQEVLKVPESLSEKEKQVLRFAAAGFSNKEIAASMHLAEGTIKNHVTRILEKLQSRDRTQAVVKALHWKMI